MYLGVPDQFLLLAELVVCMIGATKFRLFVYCEPQAEGVVAAIQRYVLYQFLPRKYNCSTIADCHSFSTFQIVSCCIPLLKKFSADRPSASSKEDHRKGGRGGSMLTLCCGSQHQVTKRLCAMCTCVVLSVLF